VWPDRKPCKQGTVLIANAEDPAETALVLRLKAAGADLSRCQLIDHSVMEGD